MNDIWFTADTHFGHAKILDYCNRPFKNVDEMNEELIKRWNERVRPEDTIYHLGDFSFGKDPSVIFRRLNGNKILIKGNHDRQKTTQLPWQSVHDYYETKVDGQFIVLSHYAFKVFNKSHHSAWQFFGHSHGSMPMNDQQVDCGVDVWNFYPVNLEQIKEKMKTLPAFRSQDGHGK